MVYGHPELIKHIWF